MTRYEQGFLAKCAEYGIGGDVAHHMLKSARPVAGDMERATRTDFEAWRENQPTAMQDWTPYHVNPSTYKNNLVRKYVQNVNSKSQYEHMMGKINADPELRKTYDQNWADYRASTGGAWNVGRILNRVFSPTDYRAKRDAAKYNIGKRLLEHRDTENEVRNSQDQLAAQRKAWDEARKAGRKDWWKATPGQPVSPSEVTQPQNLTATNTTPVQPTPAPDESQWMTDQEPENVSPATDFWNSAKTPSEPIAPAVQAAPQPPAAPAAQTAPATPAAPAPRGEQMDRNPEFPESVPAAPQTPVAPQTPQPNRFQKPTEEQRKWNEEHWAKIRADREAGVQKPMSVYDPNNNNPVWNGYRGPVRTYGDKRQFVGRQQQPAASASSANATIPQARRNNFRRPGMPFGK